MTKIKNTKKGMAKKTLSMSLVVAMLATSNVPVWAAEFSDGTDATVATEAPAAETFSDDADVAPVVEDTDATAAEATTTGVGYEVTAGSFTHIVNGNAVALTNNEITWGDAVSTSITVTAKKDATAGAELHYVWKDANGEITAESGDTNTYKGDLTLTDGTATTSTTITPIASQSNKQLSLYVYAIKDNTVVWDWTSDAITVKPKDITTVINSTQSNLPTLKTTTSGESGKIDLTYTGKDIIPTLDNFDFTATTGFTANDFVIGSTKGDTVNVTDKGVDVYLTVNKTGYTGSLVINYKISPKELSSNNVSDYLEATFVTTSKQYTGKNITLKNTDVKIVDKKSGVDLSSYVKGEDVIFISGANYIKAGTQFNTGKAGDADLTFPIATPTESKYKNYTITDGLTLKPTNSFSIKKRDLSTVNVSIKERAYQNGAIVTVNPADEDVVSFTDKTTGESLKLGTDVVITSTATTQGVHDVTVSPATNNTNVEGSTTAKLSIAASSLSTAKFSGQSYAEQAEEYTGEQITKDLSKLGTVSITDFNGATTGTHNLVKDVDYKVEFGKNIDAGVGTVTIVGLGSYVGSTKTYTFTINPAVVDTKTVTVSKYVEKKDTTTPSDYKDAMGLVVKAKNANGKEFALTEGTDYVVEKYKFTTSADADTTTGEVDGKVKVVLKTTTKNGHKYLKNTNFIVKDDEYSSTITKTTLKSENIKLKKTAYTYTGAAIKPDFDVVVDGRVINPTEYKIKSLTNNVNAGTATMVITGTDNTFTSKTDASVTFTIEAADASKLVGVVPSQVYTGYSIQPAIDSLTLNDVAISVKDNFTVTYGENVAMGEGTITLTPKNNNFTGTKTITFKITGQMLSGGAFKFYDANGLAITTLSHTYDGTAYAPAKTIFDTTDTTLTKSNGTTETNPKLVEGTDYEIKYVDNTYGKKNSSGAQQGIVLVIAKGTYGGNYNQNGVSNGVYTDAKGNKIENVVYAVPFTIYTLEIKNTNVSVANGVYAGGLPVKPVVIVNVGGKTLVEGTDYELEYGDNNDRTKVTTTKSLTVKVVGKNGYRTTDTIGTTGTAWGIDKFNLANADVTVDGDKVTVKCGRVDVETSEYTVEQKDGKVTVTAKKDSKNYTGSKTIDAATQDQKPAAPMISKVNVVGNKATVVLSGESEGAAGYDYVISTDRDCITNKDYTSVNKNQVKTESTFEYVGQGTYYAYCHAWKRDENGKKVFSDWSNAYPFVVSAITPSQPVITSVKVSGSTVTVTYTKASNADGYDVVLGTSTKKVNGETRPVEYGKLVKKNIKGNVVTATFKNVKKGTYYAGLHAFNKTSEDGKKVFSQWSNVKKVTVK